MLGGTTKRQVDALRAQKEKKMEPITVIATAISSLKTETEIATLLKTSDETFIKAELKLKLADLMNALADAKKYQLPN